jgi:hypothetical protein
MTAYSAWRWRLNGSHCARTGAAPRIEVIAFSEEEGVRFGVPFIGSRVVAGRFDTALLEFKDSDGVTMEQAIRDLGSIPLHRRSGCG